MSLRIEKGYGSWSREYSPEWWPQESGLEGLIKMDKEFLNKDAYSRIAGTAPREKLVIFEIDASIADATGGEPIFLPDGMPVGQVTSGGYGYGVDKSLALGYVRADLAKGGGKFNVSVLGQDHTGTILGEPPFDPTGTRLRN
jgi:dimethylglycine dehydrogenase